MSDTDSESGGLGLTGSMISRRQALKTGAAVGGTALWVTPLVQTIGMRPAGAQTPSPVPGVHGISFVVFRFTCSGTTYFAKLEDFSGQTYQCEGEVSDPGQNACGVSDAGASNGCESGLFTVAVTYNAEGEATLVVVTLSAGCTFVEGAVKCGIGATDPGGTGCHDATLGGGGNVASFVCP